MRIVHSIFVVLAVVGALFLWSSRARLESLHSDLEELSKQSGYIAVRDERLFHVRQVETFDEREFCWGIYLPAMESLKVQIVAPDGVLWQTQSAIASSVQRLVRFGMRTRYGKLTFFQEAVGGRTIESLGQERLALFIDEHWKDFEIQTMGQGTVVELPADEVIDLVRVRIPDSLAEAFADATGQSLPSDACFSFRIGDADAKGWQ